MTKFSFWKRSKKRKKKRKNLRGWKSLPLFRERERRRKEEDREVLGEEIDQEGQEKEGRGGCFNRSFQSGIVFLLAYHIY